jgi:hypothetical protein
MRGGEKESVGGGKGRGEEREREKGYAATATDAAAAAAAADVAAADAAAADAADGAAAAAAATDAAAAAAAFTADADAATATVAAAADKAHGGVILYAAVAAAADANAARVHVVRPTCADDVAVHNVNASDAGNYAADADADAAPIGDAADAANAAISCSSTLPHDLDFASQQDNGLHCVSTRRWIIVWRPICFSLCSRHGNPPQYRFRLIVPLDGQQM